MFAAALFLVFALAPVAAQEPAAAQESASVRPGSWLDPLFHFPRWCEQPTAGSSYEVVAGEVGADGLLADLEGPGVLRRIWLPRARGSLALAVEDREPFLVLDLAGELPEPFQGPLVRRQGGAFESLVPVPFDRRLRLSGPAGLSFRLEIERRPEADGLVSPEVGLRPAQLEHYRLASDLIETGEFLVQPRRRTSAFGRIRTNSRLTASINRAGTVLGWRLEITNYQDLDPVELLRGLRLRVAADRQVQIDVPAGDFLGASCALPTGAGHLLRLVEEPGIGLVLSSNLPMPFADSIRVIFINESLQVPLCRLYLYFTEEVLSPWRLHAAWQLHRDLSGRCRVRVADLDGPGRLIGAAVALRRTGFDGGLDPTGFFGLPPGPVVAFAAPFTTVTVGNGWTGLARLLPGTGVPFAENHVLEIPLEIGAEEVDAASLCWWYAPADAGHRHGELPDPTDRALR
ncbi:MAG: DUF2961 domain-containing protein [Planctomycetota bacterium]|nr:MAG: DUF2961 domain-containing protein [Planctomycetota bacterium]